MPKVVIANEKKEVEVPDGLLAGSVYIHAESPHTHHRLDHLFDEAPADAQQAIEAQRASAPRLQKFHSVRAALAAYNPMFMASRYLFEPGQDLSGIEIETLSQLLGALKTGVHVIRFRFERDSATPGPHVTSKRGGRRSGPVGSRSSRRP